MFCGYGPARIGGTAALAKLHALARFADQVGDQFVRMESAAKEDGGLRVLDLTEPSSDLGPWEGVLFNGTTSGWDGSGRRIRSSDGTIRR